MPKWFENLMFQIGYHFASGFFYYMQVQMPDAWFRIQGR